MGIFNEFNKKEKPVFTGLKFGFGSGGSGGGVGWCSPSASGVKSTLLVVNTYCYSWNL